MHARLIIVNRLDTTGICHDGSHEFQLFQQIANVTAIGKYWSRTEYGSGLARNMLCKTHCIFLNKLKISETGMSAFSSIVGIRRDGEHNQVRLL